MGTEIMIDGEVIPIWKIPEQIEALEAENARLQKRCEEAEDSLVKCADHTKRMKRERAELIEALLKTVWCLKATLPLDELTKIALRAADKALADAG